MVPTRLAVLPELPRTPSGKIDRRALPAPAEPAATGTDGMWSELERTIATQVLGPLLGVSDVDRSTDFFELGGNSLQATQVTSRVRDRLGVEIGLADFLAEPTVTPPGRPRRAGARPRRRAPGPGLRPPPGAAHDPGNRAAPVVPAGSPVPRRGTPRARPPLQRALLGADARPARSHRAAQGVRAPGGHGTRRCGCRCTTTATGTSSGCSTWPRSPSRCPTCPARTSASGCGTSAG